MYYEEIKLCAQNLHTIIGSIVNTMGMVYMIVLSFKDKQKF